MPKPAPLPLLAGAALAGAVALAIDAFLVEPTRTEVVEQALPLPDLPAAWEGARVIHLSDLHYGDPRSRQLFRWMVRTVNELEPDLIVITGDFVLRRASETGPCARYVAKLKAKHGILATLGDHDIDAKTRKVRAGLVEGLQEVGVRMLFNDALELPGGLRVAGICPFTQQVQRGNLDLALRALGGGMPHLLLAHSPDIIVQAREREVPMVLCGHTHGGQVVLPLLGPPVTHTNVSRRYASGWSASTATRMYTSRGLASHYSLRFRCRPEITVFTLERAPYWPLPLPGWRDP
jgi:predicted MPP superfamily phosphohydrolase